MSDVADYDLDILLWSERQAALLRGLKTNARDLPNELDLENVAEEIESVGREQLAAVESLVTQILIHALKASATPRPDLVSKWAAEASAFNLGAARRATPAILRRIDVDELWRDAVRQAKLELARFNEALPDGLPANAPARIDELVRKPLDFEALVLRIRETRGGADQSDDGAQPA